MKNLKKLASIALAAVMTLALMVPAFAADAPTASITIENTKDKATYDMYKILDVTVKDTGAGMIHGYSIATGWEAFFTTGVGATYLSDTKGEGDATMLNVNGVTKYLHFPVTIGEGDDAVMKTIVDFADDALAYALTLDNPNVTVKRTAGTEGAEDTLEVTGGTGSLNGEAVTVSGLPLGYYLTYLRGATDKAESEGSLCSLTNVDENVTLKIKATLPTIEKTSGNKDTVTKQIGETVPFTITGKVPDITNFTTYTYKVSDNMSDGLTFTEKVKDENGADVNNVVVTIGDTPISLEGKIAYKTTDNPNGFELTLTEADFKGKAVDAPIVITYSATVNENAVKVLPETNSAKLEYSNDPNDPNGNGENPPVIVKVYTYFFDLVKTDKEGVLLAGAQFKLYDNQTEGNEIPLVKVGEDADAFYRPAVEGETPAEYIEVTNGKIAIKGLSAETTYWLEETKAPDGYNLLDTREMVTLRADDPDDTSDPPKTIPANLAATVTEATTEAPLGTYTSGGVQVINLTGAELPETGGIGTTLFYAIGGLLVVSAGILLITKKRMGAE